MKKLALLCLMLVGLNGHFGWLRIGWNVVAAFGSQAGFEDLNLWLQDGPWRSSILEANR